MVWMIVLLAAICCIIPNPVNNIRIMESHRTRDIENRINPAPNMPPQWESFYQAEYVLRTASETPEMSAPIPTAPIRKPSVCGPPFRMRPAKIGISTVYGIPIRLTIAKSNRMVRTGANPET